MKKVGILTLPLEDNYGGIIQCAALSEFLKSNGFMVHIIDKHVCYNGLLKFLRKILQVVPSQNYKKFRSRYINSKIHLPFIETYCGERTKRVLSNDELVGLANEIDFDAIVVGSDQVWRIDYLDKVNYKNYFLDFLDGLETKRIAYSASFGKPDWGWGKATIPVSNLISKFDSISVRENSGVAICRSLGADNVKHTVDPTMLVDVSFYTAIMNEKNTCRKVYPATHSKKILCYVLDDSRVTENIIESTVNDLGAEYEVFRIFDKGNDFQKHTIGEWLKLFYEADFIITDSFHGTIFSILFNKQFLVLCNKDRGAARFHSLLGILQLNDRMVEPDMDGSVKEADIHEQIDYQLVNKKVEEWKEYSKQFLLESLK